MKNFLRKTGYKLQRFMYGRYGIDSLWKALIIIYLVMIVVANIVYRFSKTAYIVISVLTLALLCWGVFRAFSKNISARQKENAAWLRFWGKIKGFFSLQQTRFKQRKGYKFVKCSGCKKTLRLPKHKGKIEVTCPHCNNKFLINTGKKPKS